MFVTAMVAGPLVCVQSLRRSDMKMIAVLSVPLEPGNTDATPVSTQHHKAAPAPSRCGREVWPSHTEGSVMVLFGKSVRCARPKPLA